MQFKITSVTDIAALARATRKAADMRIDDLAATAGLSKQFVNDVELAKPTVQLARVLQLLDELGVHVYLDVLKEVEPLLAKNRAHVEAWSSRRALAAQKRRLKGRCGATPAPPGRSGADPLPSG